MEILAPAGSILALKAAIKGGANAVYLGLGEHNARIKASDFTTDNLSEWVSYAHLFGVKVYVTLNTAVKEEELSRVVELARSAAASGADALIVSDLGLVKVLSEISDVPLHLSTQAGVQNALDAEVLKDLRVKRLILSRETPLSDIPEIKKQVEEVEIFAQGAICVSFSGGCLLGSKTYGLSGNRGVCNQACRLTYTAKDEEGRAIKTGKLLSPKDLSLGEKVKELSALGVDSIKIEGRLKRPAYVYAAVKYYRDILDGKETKEDLLNLSESFNRGYFDGYTLCKSKPLVNVKTSSHVGVSIGKVLSVDVRNGYKFARVASSYALSKGDGVKILRNGLEVGGSDVTSVKEEKGAYVIPVSDGVKAGDELRLTTNAKAVLAAERVKNLLPITMTLEGGVGERLTFTARCGKVAKSVKSESLASASNSRDNAALIEKLSKVGNTDFYITNFVDKTKEPIYILTSEANALRRELLAALASEIVKQNTPSYRFTGEIALTKSLPQQSGTVFEIADLTYKKEYDDATAFVLTPETLSAATLTAFVTAAGDRKCYLRLPRILRNGEIAFFEKLLSEVKGLGVFTDNLYGVALARKLPCGYVVGFGMNVFNGKTASLFSDADFICASVEDNRRGNLVFRAGKVALMNFAHCPFSVAFGYDCAHCGKTSKMFYENADGRYLVTRRVSASCDFTMYEDKVTVYPKPYEAKNLFYRFIGLNDEEKRDMMKVVSEDIGEQKR
ncbi:MAG: U32 family peptidase [Clostridia bacterium]|nr:U32 family peptidase [Clostridia bacterium]